MVQRTLKKSFKLQGKGLHTGIEVTIVFHPAPINYGYKVRRTDITNTPIIDALAENVTSTFRGITLGNSNISISTIEHALAALYACEIDNCLIDINGPEFPIMDGSSIAFVKKIIETGADNQNAKREYLYFPRKKIRVRDDSSRATMMLIPDTTLKIESHISFDSILIKKQEAMLEDLTDFIKDFASARTFIFVNEIESLLTQNLIKGGSLDNAIVIYDRIMEQSKLDELSDLMRLKRRKIDHLGYLMHKPLIYPNEPARHKLLDIIGDIALVGYFIKGKIIAHNPGHTINNLLAREIRNNINHYQRKQRLEVSERLNENNL